MPRACCARSPSWHEPPAGPCPRRPPTAAPPHPPRPADDPDADREAAFGGVANEALHFGTGQMPAFGEAEHVVLALAEIAAAVPAVRFAHRAHDRSQRLRPVLGLRQAAGHGMLEL